MILVSEKKNETRKVERKDTLLYALVGKVTKRRRVLNKVCKEIRELEEHSRSWQVRMSQGGRVLTVFQELGYVLRPERGE